MGTLAIRTSLDVGSEELVKEIFKNLQIDSATLNSTILPCLTN